MARGIPRLLVLLCAAPLFAQPYRPDRITATRVISAESLRASVTFLASDELEGRATPSPGLDKAADYIAEQFRQIGLAPINGSYFQEAPVNGGTARNVAGLYRGSDPKLRDTYVIVSAHYDHVGLAKTGDDLIFNGANDDASGTASVIEIAKVIASIRPARSVLFLTFFGEERGLLGSRYYGQHPLVPLESTIAQVNLEQLGRTDATNGPQVRGANVTGFDMSDLPAIMADAAAKPNGVRIWKDATASDAYFGRSDNQALADLGIPAHTLSVAYNFPDYHKVTDSAEKLDYENMALIDRAISLGVMELASNAPPPTWNEGYAPANKYAEAARKLHATSATN
ncbi:MAG: M28 family peptidase [Acidobacteriota bacterium]